MLQRYQKFGAVGPNMIVAALKTYGRLPRQAVREGECAIPFEPGGMPSDSIQIVGIVPPSMK